MKKNAEFMMKVANKHSVKVAEKAMDLASTILWISSTCSSVAPAVLEVLVVALGVERMSSTK